MPNPTLTKKIGRLYTVSENTKKLFQAVFREKVKKVSSDDEVPKIKVSEMVSKMAFYYEKIRNSVDYEEEHLLRKNAIDRILKRQIVIEGAMSTKERDSQAIAKHLLTELIRAGYLPNNQIPESKIEELAVIIKKYLLFRQYILEKHQKEVRQGKGKLVKWIIAVAASEIEEKLGYSQVDQLIIDYMYRILEPNIKLPNNSPYEKDKEIQIYIGIYRRYLKFDEDMMSFVLFKHYFPSWQDATDEQIKKIAENILTWQNKINDQIDHPLAVQLNRIITRYTVFFSILLDVVKEDPEGIYGSFQNDPKIFYRQIKDISNKKYKRARVKLWRAAVRSIIYIFITKSIFAILLEVPAAKWFGEEINPLSLVINISFPALLLFIIIMFTKLPSQANTDKIIEGIEEIVFEERERREPFRLRQPAKRSTTLNAIFGLIYAITFFLSFGFTVWALDKINFSWVSIIIFLFFLAFISFFSIRIRRNAKELIIIEQKENIFSFIGDFFYVPIVATGKWLSEKFQRINVFVFLLDFIIEAPFKIIVEIAEEWTKYVKERKDELV